jgi:hypothetical protein
MMRQRLSFLEPEAEPLVVELRPPEQRVEDFNTAQIPPKEGLINTQLALERTKLADDRTDLAILRTDLANKRTLLAYVRTAISVAVLAQKQNNSLISIAGIVFISLAFVDYLYHYFWVHPAEYSLPSKFDKGLYGVMTFFPVIVAAVAVYVLGSNV